MTDVCCYGCNIPVIGNPVQCEYWELRKNKKHQCLYLEKQTIQPYIIDFCFFFVYCQGGGGGGE